MQTGEIKEAHQEFQFIATFDQLDEPLFERFVRLISYEIGRHEILPALLTELGKNSRGVNYSIGGKNKT